MRRGVGFFVIVLISLSVSAFAYDWSTNPGSGDPNNPYQISEPNQLIAIGPDPNLLDKHFVLMNDIVFDPNNNPAHVFTQALIAPATGISPNNNFIGNPFSGSFDGNNHIVSNILIDSTLSGNSFLGLFGEIENGSYIQDVAVRKILIKGNNFSSVLGGLCGSNKGVIYNCSVSGFVQAGSSYGVISGFCGFNNGFIFNSYSKASVFCKSYNYISAFCARNEGVVRNCYSSGAARSEISPNCIGNFCGINYGGTIDSCYSNGIVEDEIVTSATGAFCGHNSYGSINNCFFLDTSGPDNGYGTPLDAPNMMIQSNFVGWDFVDEAVNGENEIWRMCVDGVDYPRLSWEFSDDGDFVCPDGTGMEDLEALAASWLLDELDVDFCPTCDPGEDGLINLEDYAVLAEHWLQGVMPFLTLSERHLFVTVDETGPNPGPTSVVVSNLSREGGSYTIDYIGGQPDWVDVTPTSGTFNGYEDTTFTVSVDALAPSIVPGSYAQNVAIISPEAVNSPQVFTVHLTVIDQASYLTATPDACSFQVPAGGPNPVPDSIMLENTGEIDSEFTINYPGGQPDWLDVTPTSGTLVPTDSTYLTISIDVIDPLLPIGTYSTMFEILDPQSPTSPVEVSVTLDVTN